MKAAEIRAEDSAEIDAFCDSVWLEDGLAKASLASYRSDLETLLRLAEQTQTPDAAAPSREAALMAFVAELSTTLRASSQARYISTLRRYYRHLLARGQVATDPTLKIAMPAKPSRLPKVLSEKNRSKPCSASRKPTRRSACATEPCSKRSTPPACAFPSCRTETARAEPRHGRGSCLRQGQQGTAGAARGGSHRLAARSYLPKARPALLDKQQSRRRCLSPPRREAMSRQAFWQLIKRYARLAGLEPADVAPRHSATPLPRT
jgi:integrase/recombinase XerD